MKEIAIISGKGGTGKTSITAALAGLEKKCSMVDCDVDGANLSLIAKHEVLEEEDFVQGDNFSIDEELCSACGKCRSLCRFNAISKDFIINPIFCEGCGVCAFFCPTQAISHEEKVSGKIFSSHTERGPFFHARLGIGEGNTGKLVSQLRKKNSIELRKNEEILVTYLDGPPGTGCPLIATITGVHAALIVTEPSVSAIHDLVRLEELCRKFKIKMFLCINRADINEALSQDIELFSRDRGITFTERINYDPLFLKAQKEGMNIMDFTENETAVAIRNIHSRLSDFIKGKDHESPEVPSIHEGSSGEKSICKFVEKPEYVGVL